VPAARIWHSLRFTWVLFNQAGQKRCQWASSHNPIGLVQVQVAVRSSEHHLVFVVHWLITGP